jgi:hypothetical protein
MTDTAQSATAVPAALRALFHPWTPAHSFGVLCAIFALCVAGALQITMLSGWHAGASVSNIALSPTNASVSLDTKATTTLSYSFSGPPAISATGSINVSTEEVIGVSLDFDRIVPGSTLTLGWVSSRDRRKPSNLAVKLPTSATPQTIYVPLRGHGAWRDNVTQFAVVLVAPPGSAAMTLSNPSFVAATPAAAARHAWGAWFDSPSQLQASAVARRVLPISFLLVLASLISFAAIRVFKRNDSVARRGATASAAVALSLVALLLSAVAPNAFTLNASLAPWWLASVALLIACFGRAARLPNAITRLYAVEVVSLGVAAGCVALGGVGFVWVVLAVLVLHLAHYVPLVFSRAKTLLFFGPAIAIGGIVQAAHAKHIDIPDTSFADPSAAFASLVHQSAGFSALLAVLALAYAFWPRTVGGSARSSLGITLWLVVIGTIGVYALRNNGYGLSTEGAGWALLPCLITAIAWLSPRFISPIATTAAETKIERTEHDLSAVVRQLFDGSAASFDSVLTSDHPGSALAPLNRMKEIAPASSITHASEVRYALKNDKLAGARTAYESLKRADASTLSASARSALLEYANRSDDFETVIEQASADAPSEARARMVARAQLLAGSNRDAAQKASLATLEAHPKPNLLSHEIAELHLLTDDWQAAQRALVDSQITPQSLPGQIYVARMGLRATGGQTSYVDQIQKLATWNNTLGVAQMAMAELLLTQGNAQGARARFLLARKLDATLWAAERRIRDIDATGDLVPAPAALPTMATANA